MNPAKRTSTRTGSGPLVLAGRLKNASAVKPLKSATEHRTVVLVEKPPSDVDDTARIDPQ